MLVKVVLNVLLRHLRAARASGRRRPLEVDVLNLLHCVLVISNSVKI